MTARTFDIIALLLVLSAGFGWLNHRLLRLPHGIGLLLMGLAASLLLVLLDLLMPQSHLYADLTERLLHIDFTGVVMDGMLAFLLFAGALTLDLGALRDRAWRVAGLAVLGTVISTAVVGFGLWPALDALCVPLPLPWALVFGALISPTDPVAVLATLRNVRVPPTLEIEVQGEALFNDGVGVVLFTLLLAFAARPDDPPGAATVLEHLVWEAGGGLALGFAAGWIAFRAMRAIDDFPVEVLITLALVTGTYAVSRHLHMSGPLAVVAAGLLIGDRGIREAMSDRTRRYVTGLWTLIDEVLNSVLFLLIGLEVLVLRFDADALWVGAVAVPLALLGRVLAVSAPLLLPRLRRQGHARTIPFLAWAGVRGGISVALALSLPADAARGPILAATYAVVLFTIVVQGGTLGLVARRTLGAGRAEARH